MFSSSVSSSVSSVSSVRASSFPALGWLVASGVIGLSAITGCAVDTDTSETSESALSSTRARVVPSDDLSRAACRDAASKVYCTESEASAALNACSPGGKNGKVAVESKAGKCSASGLAYPTVASCETPLELDCSYYGACLDKAIPCGTEGYALGFGEKYCTAFRAAPLSAAGKKWVTRVMGCLQTALVPDVLAAGEFAKAPASQAKCKEVFDRAFDSHPGCYTAKEGSICFLPPSDLATVLKTIGLKEILTRRTGGQMATTVGICVGQITQRIFGFGQSKAAGAVGTRGVELSGPEESLSREDLEASLAQWKSLEAETNVTR
jgi:hypothetical protein